jgi:hypothetical protein
MLSPSSSPPSSPLSHPTAQPSSAFPVQWRSGRTTQQSHSLRPSSASPVQQRRSFLPAAQPSPTSLSTSRPPLPPATVVYLLSPAAPSSSPPSSPLSHPAAQRSYHPTVQPSSTSLPPNSTALLHLFALASSNSPAKQCSRNLSFSHPAAQPSPVQQHSGRTTQQSTSLPINSIAVVHLSMQPSSKCCAALSHLAFRLFPNYSSRTTVVHLSHPAVPLPSSSTALSLLI